MTKSDIWKCYCGETFQKAYQLSNHTDTKHVAKVVIDTPVLSESNQHTFTRQIDGNFHCIVCQSIYISASEFKKHLSNECLAEDEKERHWCSRCDSDFDTQQDLKAHLTKEHGLDTMVLVAPLGIKERIKLAIKSNDKFECPFCPNEYDTLLKLTQHVQHRCDVVKESNIKSNFQCEKCDEIFSSRIRLEHHTYNRHLEVVKVNTGYEMVQISREQNDRLACPTCKIFTTPTIQTLVIHIRDKCSPSELGEHCCEKCNSKFKLKSALFKHKHSIHSPAVILKYQSPVSGKWKNITKDRTPTNKLNCPACGIGYIDVAQLIDHVSNKCSIIRGTNNVIFKFVSSCIITEKAIDLEIDKENCIMLDDD